MKKNIELNGVDSMAFLGANDINIKILENTFNSKIVVRGNKVLLDGDADEVHIIQHIIDEMIITINAKGYIDKNDVETIVLLNKDQINNIETDGDDEDVILYTHKGKILAKTNAQKKYHKAIIENDIVFAIGPAGTGKTYQAVACAISALKKSEVEKIIITRPAVEAGERLGFLPGDLKEKVDPYLTPLYDALNNMISKDKLKYYLTRNIIEIAPLAYMRGRTLHNSFIILDEAQNSTRMQMKMFLTRIGVTSKAVITGDTTQVDLPNNEVSGLIDSTKVLKDISGIKFIFLTDKDVVRHELVKKIIKAYNNLEIK